MDWFSWLPKTGLEPSLIHEYGQVFSNNELEEEDIAYFNHELLQSMGISIAKHRLEILKLARKEGPTRPFPMTRVLVAIKRAKTSLCKHIKALACNKQEPPSSALVLVPRTSSGCVGMLKKPKKLLFGNNNSCDDKQGTLLLTNGTSSSPKLVVSSPSLARFSCPLVHDVLCKEEKEISHGHVNSDGYKFDSTTNNVKEIRWDSLFQNLKPT